MRFWLGTDRPNWIGTVSVPLFLSRVVLEGRRRYERAIGPWALDSGAFSEIAKHGRWRMGPRDYAVLVRRLRDEIGSLAWAAPQDWMCEPAMLAKTGKTVAEHQALTTENYIELRSMAPDLDIIPVLQGWTLDDYRRHVDAYDRRAVDLRMAPLVGLGSVCRRQSTPEIARVVGSLASLGIRLHGFGMKMTGLRRVGHALTSADSMAWCRRARWAGKQDGCPKRSCAHCLHFALAWRDRLIASTLFLAE